jgi:hypothetical protein
MNKSGTAAQVIARPQGGGAIKGIGDTFSSDLHTGTGNLTVPIAIAPGRNQLQPEPQATRLSQIPGAQSRRTSVVYAATSGSPVSGIQRGSVPTMFGISLRDLLRADV